MRWTKKFFNRLLGLDKFERISERIDNINKIRDKYLTKANQELETDLVEEPKKKDFSPDQITNNKWQFLLVKHKKQISALNEQNYRWLLPKIIGDMEKLALFYSGFKCQHCGSTKRLTFHHLIQRNTKSFVDFNRYLCIRYYWANLLVLCTECHLKIEGRNNKEVAEKMLSIPKKNIESIKKYFGAKK